MKNMKKYFIYILLPIQILVLLMSPRFGWSIHNGVDSLSYEEIHYSGADINLVYGNDQEKIQIAYANPFSREFKITVNDTDKFYMNVDIDGGESYPDQAREDIPGYIGSAIVWNDPAGIFYGRYLVSIAFTVCSIAAFTYAKKYAAGVFCKILYCSSAVTYIISMLISFRVIW